MALTLRYLTFIHHQAKDAGLLAAQGVSRVNAPLYIRIAAEDPGAALTLLRREIELTLQDIAIAQGLSITEETKLFHLIKMLKDEGVLTPEQSQALSHLRRGLNVPVHTRFQDKDAVRWLFNFGPPLLAALDLILKSYNVC